MPRLFGLRGGLSELKIFKRGRVLRGEQEYPQHGDGDDREEIHRRSLRIHGAFHRAGNKRYALVRRFRKVPQQTHAHDTEGDEYHGNGRDTEACEGAAEVVREIGKHDGIHLAQLSERRGAKYERRGRESEPHRHPAQKQEHAAVGIELEPFAQALCRLAQEAFGVDKTGYPQSPDHVRPIRAVPQSAEEEHNKSIEDLARRALSVAAEGNIDVVGEPARERDMPAVEEIGIPCREIRSVEVARQPHAHHARAACGDKRVSREIAEHLQHEQKSGGVDGKGVGVLQVAEHVIDEYAYVIRDDAFQKEAVNKIAQSRRHIVAA